MSNRNEFHYHKMGVLSQDRILIVFFCFIAFAAFAVWAPQAHARSNFFDSTSDGDCASCHIGQDTSVNDYCGVCHRHGVSTSSSGAFNVQGTTNKASYAPGETVSVTISGGSRPSRARAVLYDQNQLELNRSSGTVPPDGDAPVNAPKWPVTLTAPAPTTPGTYTWSVAWYGNQNGGGPHAPPPGVWKVDPSNSDHGWEIVPLASFTVTDPSPSNNPPVLGAIGDKTVNEGSLLSFTATATDPNAVQTLTFSLTGAPAGAAINPSTGAFTWTPTESQGPGSFPVTVRVTDNGSPAMSDTEAITVTVNEVNVAPVLAPIGNKSGTVGSPVTFTATATDSDIPAQTRTFSLGAGAPSGATINASSGTFSWTPSTDGDFSVTVIVTDSGTPALNDSEAITIAVTPPGNTAPVANPDSYSTDAGIALNVGAPGVLGNDTDANGDPLTAVKVSDPAHGSVTLGANGSFTYTPAAGYDGPDSFTYKANDGKADGNTATVSITIADAAPTLTGLTIGSPSSVQEDSSAQYKANASWSDGSTSDVTANASWSVSPDTYASISGGLLKTSSVPGDQTVELSARYTAGDVYKTATKTVTILDVPGDPSDTVPPTVVSTNPFDLAVDVYVNTVIEATFSEQINPSSLESGNFRVRDPENIEVPGTVSYSETPMTATFSPSAPLAYGTVYTAEIKPGVEDLAGNSMESPYIWTFTTQESCPDSDGDGVGDCDDDQPHDCRNATPRTPRGNGKIKLELKGKPSGCLKNVTTFSDMDLSVSQEGKPGGYEFPDGLVYYEVEGISPGDTETVILTFPEALSDGSKAYKVDSDGFTEYSGVSISGRTVALTVTDGGLGDSDRQANGVIVDPVGVAVPTAAGSGSIDMSTDAAGGGCSVVGAGGGWKEAAGSFGLLVLAWLGLALRRRKPENGR